MTDPVGPAGANARDAAALGLDPADLDPGHSADPVPSPSPSPVDSDRTRAAQGGRWGIVSGVIEQGGSMLATVVLARLLSPADFGVVAAATLLLNLLFMFANVGWAAALIRRRTITEPISSTTFWAATGLGGILTLALMLLAPALAALLHQPDITPYVIALAPLLLISMVSSVSEARLLRELRFPWVYTADIANIAIYAGVTLALALSGVGAWSMVIGRLAGEAVAAGIRLFAARWWPAWVFEWSVIKEDLQFNRSFLAIQITNFLSKNLDYWVVSRTLGATALGVYYVAFVLPTILRQRMTWLGTEILLPLMSRAVGDRARLESLYRDSMEVLCFVAVPLLVGIALTADQIITIAFGEEWLGAVEPLQWLAVAATVEVTAHAGATLFMALDLPKIPSRMLLGRLVLTVVALLIAREAFGTLNSIAAAVAIATATSTTYIHLEVSRRAGISFASVARRIAPIAAATVAMAVAVIAAARVVDDQGPWVQSIVKVGTGATTYLGLAMLLDRTLTIRMLRVGGRLVRRG